MDAGTGFTDQAYELSPVFLHKVIIPKILYFAILWDSDYRSFFRKEYERSGIHLQEWIIEQWEKNFYISAIAGTNNGSSLVVMSKGQSSDTKHMMLLVVCHGTLFFPRDVLLYFSWNIVLPYMCFSFSRNTIHSAVLQS